jgi:predicted MFS family arabinose efflux permease
MSMTGDMVPLEVRGRYFASRNFATGISGIIVTLLAGQLISSTSQPAGYQLALVLAFLLGISSVFSFSHLKEPRSAELSHHQAPLISREMLSHLGSHPVFLSLAATAALWNFSINIAAPFFNVYLVQNLGASAAMVAVTGVAATITGLFVQRKLGVLADRWGSRRMQLISGLLIPILPWAWMLVAAPWQVIPINLFNGVVWGAYNLASFNFLLEVIPVNQRSSYSALFQIVVTLSLSAGAAIGGLVVARWGYHTIFFLSGLGRVIAAVLFARFVRTEVPAPKPVVGNTAS